MSPDKTTFEDVEYVIDFAQDTISALLADPDAALFKPTVTGDSIMLAVRASRQECGRVIGRDGTVIRAIKVLCAAVARKNRCYLTIDLHNNEDADVS